MAITVRIPIPLMGLTNNQEEVEGISGTLINLIGDLDKRFPGIMERLTEDGKIRKFINFYINGTDIRFLELEIEKTLVKDGDEISIIPALAGGEQETESNPNNKVINLEKFRKNKATLKEKKLRDKIIKTILNQAKKLGW